MAKRKRTMDEMAFLMSRNASKHVLLALSVDRTARDVVKAKFTRVPMYTLVSYTLRSVV